MSDPTIEQLQAQLASLKASQIPSIKPSIGLTVDDIRQTVKEVLASELGLLKPSKPLTLLEAIGLGLTEEEQVWLSDPSRLQGIETHLPLFFQTEEGKASVKSFVQYYKDTYV